MNKEISNNIELDYDAVMKSMGSAGEYKYNDNKANFIIYQSDNNLIERYKNEILFNKTK